MPAFDLVREPWLTCVTLEGERRPYGLHGLLANAHRVKELAEPSPLVTFGAYRLLLAMVHWLRPIKTALDWRSAWDADRFPPSLSNGLASRGERKFDLFEESAPFYQHPREAMGRRPVSVAYLALHMPSGTNINHFCHVYDAGHAFCPACCAQGLVSMSPFAPGYSRWHPPSINGAPPLYVLPCGETLFHTLMLNLPIREYGDIWGPAPPADVPAWERGTPRPAGRGREPVGVCEGLTWQPRRALLLPNEGEGQCTCCGRKAGVVVAQMALGNGGDARGRPWTDPHLPMKADTGKPVLPNLSPDFWHQQVRSVLPSTDGIGPQPPPVLKQLIRLLEASGPPASATIPVRYVALHVDPTSQGKTIRWLDESIHVPSGLLADASLCACLREELDRLGEVGRQFAREIGRKGAWKEARAVLQDFHTRTRQGFWQVVATADQGRVAGLLERFWADVLALAHDSLSRLRLRRPVAGRWQIGSRHTRFDRRLRKALEQGGKA